MRRSSARYGSGHLHRQLVRRAVPQPQALRDRGSERIRGRWSPALDSPSTRRRSSESRCSNAAIPDAAKLATFRYWGLRRNTIQPREPGCGWRRTSRRASRSPWQIPRGCSRSSMAMADTVAPTYMTVRLPCVAADDRDPPCRRGRMRIPSVIRPGRRVRERRRGTLRTGRATARSALQRLRSSAGSSATTRSRSAWSPTLPAPRPAHLSGFSAAATEAGRSRVVGGLHFEFSNQDGASAGRSVAAEVLDNALLVERGPTRRRLPL